MNEMLNVHPLSWPSLGSCILAATIIGLERQLHGKPIGVRTSCLICLGTYVFVTMGRAITSEAMDPSRIIGQMVTGVGFLGAGVMFSRGDSVVGVTSAAAIWILAAVGVTIGQGYSWLGVKIALLTTVLLVGVDALERSCTLLQRGDYHRRKGTQNDRTQ